MFPGFECNGWLSKFAGPYLWPFGIQQKSNRQIKLLPELFDQINIRFLIGSGTMGKV